MSGVAVGLCFEGIPWSVDALALQGLLIGSGIGILAGLVNVRTSTGVVGMGGDVFHAVVEVFDGVGKDSKDRGEGIGDDVARVVFSRA